MLILNWGEHVVTNDINLPNYDGVRTIINNMRNNSKEWNYIENQYNALTAVFAIPDFVTKEKWLAIVKDLRKAYELSQHIEFSRDRTTIMFDDEDLNVNVPTDERSSWQLYKGKLVSDGWNDEAVASLERTTIALLRKLNRDTTRSGPIKGLVIGKVQSGKTASMAALMAMAADWGWNTFIVLSGMIENLRAQTQARLISDLNHSGNNTWLPLDKLSANSEVGNRLQDLHLGENETTKYLNICLKNKTRLENLIRWFKDKNKLKQMKILIIDDEADQGSVNTKTPEERAKINELIINLVEVNKDNNYPRSMNYISYTATPYSNLLNESSRESLYPKDFIGLLEESNEYIGAKQIFGIEDSTSFNGMNIIREISEEELSKVKDLQEGKIKGLPQTLQDSIMWFYCSVAAMRYRNYKKPISLLIHTSQKQEHHLNVASSVERWIRSVDDHDFLRLCKEVYIKEIEAFGISEFIDANPNYPRDKNTLNEFPEFNAITNEILNLKGNLTNIKMDDDGELEYHNGTHLCIDNCAHNGVNEEDMHIRLAYPTKEKLSGIEKAPAFIVIGGSTLSRGLTIEGLVSTYFLRASTTADSLMQMGRWFGYRKGYETHPRIWMSKDTFDKFCFLATLEEELREEIKEFSIGNKSPKEYGPRIKNSPKVSWIRVTAKNKMQNAEEIEMDFTGSSIQTIHFENIRSELESNIQVTENFLNERKSPRVTKLSAKSALVFEDIKFEDIKAYLKEMKFNSRSRVFNQIDLFCEWYETVQEELEYDYWNVIVAGSGEITENTAIDKDTWGIGPYAVGKVNRSAKKTNMDDSSRSINIGVLRGPNDLFADIDDDAFITDPNKSVKSKDIRETREKYGLGKVPQLLIYRIKHNSKAGKSSESRVDINFKEDLIGIYINIPSNSTNKPHAKALRVKLENVQDNE